MGAWSSWNQSLWPGMCASEARTSRHGAVGAGSRSCTRQRSRLTEVVSSGKARRRAHDVMYCIPIYDVVHRAPFATPFRPKRVPNASGLKVFAFEKLNGRHLACITPSQFQNLMPERLRQAQALLQSNSPGTSK